MDDFWFNVTFICRRHDAERVFLVGDFCGWKTGVHKMEKCEEGYSITLPLSEGFYHYKFRVDGTWECDEHNPHRGGLHGNSVMFVHMDPNVYGLREQHPPHRDYHRPGSDGSHFQVLQPKLPSELAAHGILERLVFVYLPPSYLSDCSRRYPVVYAHDGQNLFSTPEHMGGPFRGGWYLDAKLDYLWSQGKLPEFILVAVPNSDFVCIGNRTKEYCTAQYSDTTQDYFVRYLIEVVKAEIDGRFRTIPDANSTVTLGASMGGLLAFVLAMSNPETFSCAICMSPSFWYVDKNNSSAFNLVRDFGGAGRQPSCRLYVDSGDGAGDNRYDAEMMCRVLQESGWRRGKEFEYHLDECRDQVDMEITHSESVWKERVHLGLQFAFRGHK